jgi:hypothetical protein
VAGCSATSATTNAPSPTTAAGGGGGGAVVASSGAQKFIQSKFKHGRLWRGELKDSDYDAFDYVTIWIGYEASLNYGRFFFYFCSLNKDTITFMRFEFLKRFSWSYDRFV